MMNAKKQTREVPQEYLEMANKAQPCFEENPALHVLLQLLHLHTNLLQESRERAHDMNAQLITLRQQNADVQAGLAKCSLQIMMLKQALSGPDDNA